MMLHIPGVLGSTELQKARDVLARAPWTDGRATSGQQSAQVKNNHQLPEDCAETQQLQQLILGGLERQPLFFSATLPKHISPPMLNRYSGAANSFGNHVDTAVRYLPHGAGRVRTDISCTLFLSPPDSYTGGELVIEDTYNHPRIKLAAGDLILYPGTSVHRVEPVTRGERLAAFFWIQSMVRSTEQRALLFNMDQHLMRLRSTAGETDPAIVGLTGTYHNLLRMWAST
jgi:PKHD-type hydroxylase